jgi:hypothetical protein
LGLPSNFDCNGYYRYRSAGLFQEKKMVIGC